MGVDFVSLFRSAVLNGAKTPALGQVFAKTEATDFH